MNKTKINNAHKTTLPRGIWALGIVLLFVPVSAHLSPEGSASSALFTSHNGLDNCRMQGFKEVCNSRNGVSGTYINYYQNKYFDVPTLFPEQFGFATMWCDLEVGGDGESSHPLDEGRVDDEPTSGLIVDGTWDDGGVGGACHTADAYGADGYDSPGCYGEASAKDAVSGWEVWIGAGCDWMATGGGPGLGICLANEVATGATAPGVVDCAADFLAGPSGATFVACGADGTMEDIYYGHGDFGVPFINLSNYYGCDSDDAASAVFTYDYINEETLELVPATAGWIDSR